MGTPATSSSNSAFDGLEAQLWAAADALRSFGQKTDGRLPGTIVGLPPELGALMSTLLKSPPAAPPAAH